MPIGLAYAMLIALAIYLTDTVFGLAGSPMRMLVLVAINLVLSYVVFVTLDRGLLITGSRGRGAAGGLQRVA
jgi:uncharacterized membrane protein